MSIYKKLAEAKKEIGKISKDSTNPFFNSKYFDINSLLEHVEPILHKHGLMVLQPISNDCVMTIIRDIDGTDSIDSVLKLPDVKDPQKIGSCVSYYRRYTLQSLLALQAVDDDGNKASGYKPKDGGTSYKTLGEKENDLPWLNMTRSDKKTHSPQWYNILNAIAEGKITSLEQVREVYKVSKVTAKEIEKLLS